MSGPRGHKIKAVLIDFGGVLAEEGFREGLKAIGRNELLAPEAFFEVAASVVYESGYVLGKIDENTYWNLIREKTGVKGSDQDLRAEILDRFTLRPWMLETVSTLRRNGYQVCILSDQTQWLDELDDKYGFFKYFDMIFNSYHMGKGKRDPTIFADVASQLGLAASEILFVDDNEGNVGRAAANGWNTILFRDRETFLAELKKLVSLD